MLLARLEGQDVARATVAVDGLPDDPAGHAADVRHARGDQTEVRAAVVQVVAEGLSFGDGDVGPEGAGRREHAERQRIEDLDQRGAGSVGTFRERADGLEDPEPVRVLDDHGGDVVTELGLVAPAGVGEGRASISCPVGIVEVRRVCTMRGSTPPVTTTRERSFDETHVDRLDECGRPVVQRCVRDLELRQSAHHRLELEQHLQHALRELELVGRVRGRELGTARQRLHDRRNVVVVRLTTREAHQDLGGAVPRGERRCVADDLELAHAVGEVEGPIEPDPGGI